MVANTSMVVNSAAKTTAPVTTVSASGNSTIAGSAVSKTLGLWAKIKGSIPPNVLHYGVPVAVVIVAGTTIYKVVKGVGKLKNHSYFRGVK